MVRAAHPRLYLLALAHLSVDAYAIFFAPLLPLLVTKLDLSLTHVGTLVALTSFSASLSQPLFGMVSDRMRRPWFVAYGPLATALFISLIGIAPSFAALALCLMLAGLGSAAFHPQATALASAIAQGRAAMLAIFVTGGNIGFSLGPVFAAGVVQWVGLERSWVAAAPGLAIAALVLVWFARVAPRPRGADERPRFRELRPVAGPLALLYFGVVFRSAVSFGFVTFLPLHLHAHGFSLARSGAALTTYLVSGAVGGILGGWAADRWGGRRVIVGSFLGAAPLFASFLLLPPAGPALLVLALGSLVLQMSNPVNVVLGQQLSPRHASTIASLLMGAAWGIGQLMVGPVGALADAVGIRNALLALTSLLLAGLACAVSLPRGSAHPVPDPALRAGTELKV